MTQNITLIPVFFTLACLFFPVCSRGANEEIPTAEKSKSLPSYHSPSERFYHHQGIQLYEWLSIKTNIELEKQINRDHYPDNTVRRYDQPSSQLLEIELETEIHESFGFSLLIESEAQDEDRRSEIADRTVHFFHDRSELSAGRFDVQFSEFESRFISSPLIEFAETKADAISLIHLLQRYQVAVGVYIVKSIAGKSADSSDFDYAAAISWINTDMNIRIGAGYLSDLAESDVRFLADFDNTFESRVSAISYFFSIAWERYLLSAEAIRATSHFNELDEDRNQPRASNIELSWYPHEQLQLSIRYEASIELAGAPERRQGISVAWRPTSGVEIAAEYLHEDYKSGFVVDDNNQVLSSGNMLVARFTVEF